MNIEDFVANLATRVGITEAQAKQVIEFLKEHADEIPGLLGSDALDKIKSKLPGGLGGLFG